MIKLICEVTTKEEFESYLKLRLDDDYSPYIKISMSNEEWEDFDINLVELDGSISFEDNEKADFLKIPEFTTFEKYQNYIDEVKKKLEANGLLVNVF